MTELVGSLWRGRPGEQPNWWEGRLFRVTRRTDAGVAIVRHDEFSGLEFGLTDAQLRHHFVPE